MDPANDIVIVESTLVPEEYGGLDGVRASLKTAEQRGTFAASTIVTGAGVRIGSPLHEDREVAFCGEGRRTAFVRTPIAEALGSVVGSSWVRAHSPDLAFRSGSPYLGCPPSGFHLYVNDGDGPPSSASPIPTDLEPASITWHPTDSRLAVASLAGRTGEGPVYRIAELDLDDRSIARSHWLPPGTCRPDRIRFSPDGTILLATDLDRRQSVIVHRGAQQLITLPVRSAAVDWHPTVANSLLVITTATEHRAEVQTFDLSTWATTTVGVIEADRRVDFRELAVHPMGNHALACAPVGTTAEIQDQVRGGLYATAIIDLAAMTFEPVMSAHLPDSPVQRVHHSPSWTLPRAVATTSRVAAHAVGQAVSTAAAQEVEPEVLRRRAASCAGQARELRRTGRHHAPLATELADDVTALTGSVRMAAANGELPELDFDVDGNLATLLDVAGLRSPDPSAGPDATEQVHALVHGPRPSRLLTPGRSGDAEPTLPPVVRRHLEAVVAAPGPEEAAEAAAQLRVCLARGDGMVWDTLLELQYAIAPTDAALVALAAFNWSVEYTEMFPMLVSAMTRPTPSAEAQLLRNGCSACLLIGDDDAFVARGREHPYDVGEVFDRATYRLDQLDDLA